MSALAYEVQNARSSENCTEFAGEHVHLTGSSGNYPLTTTTGFIQSSIAGLGALVRFNLRRDRTRILVWTASIAALYAYCVTAFAAVFATPAEQQARAAVVRTPASILMSGPGFGIDDYWIGPMLANELLLWFAGAVALMSIQMAVRHSRAEEESSRSELVRSLPVGRHAPALAAFLAVVIANALIFAVSFLILLVISVGHVGSAAAFAGGVALVGIAFGAVALVFAQVTAHSRAATGLAVGVLLAAVLVRGVGDLRALGGSWVSWLSPIAWAHQTRLYVDLRWWPLLLLALLAALCVGLAFALERRRDFGAGLVAARPGPAVGRLGSPFALTLRLSRGQLIGWGVGVAVAFIAFGTYLTDIGELFTELIAQNPAFALILSPADLAGSFVHLMLMFAAVLASAFGITGMRRAGVEEAEGRAELLLAHPVSRLRYLAASLAVPLLGAAALMLLAGLSVWLGGAAVGFDALTLGSALTSALQWLPAVVLVVAIAAALHAFAPRALPLVWALVAWGLIDGMFGDMIGAPTAARGLSPFHWVPSPLSALGASAAANSATTASQFAPSASISLGVLTATAVVVLISTAIGYQRREIPRA